MWRKERTRHSGGLGPPRRRSWRGSGWGPRQNRPVRVSCSWQSDEFMSGGTGRRSRPAGEAEATGPPSAWVFGNRDRRGAGSGAEVRVVNWGSATRAEYAFT